MGIALWAVCGVVAMGVARLVPALRRTQWLSELALAVIAALLAGLAATALDFGGLNELDWRAGLFAFACAFAATAWLRVARFRTS